MERSEAVASQGTGMKGNKIADSSPSDAQATPDAAPIPVGSKAEAKSDGWRSGEVLFGTATREGPEGTCSEVNMEAAIAPEDVVRAGGFGARDDISSFLPVASDSTDFEASIRDARDYEEAQGDMSRPGLGWGKESKTK